MRAIRYSQYGGPEVLKLVTEPEPVAQEGELVLKVEAAALNAKEWHELRGKPWFIRLAYGLTKPRSGALGNDVAGVVTAVGPGVSGFKVGDRVVGGTNKGPLAESVAIKATNATLVPDSVDPAVAATLVIAGCTALQAVRDWAGVKEGAKVLVHGASGGVGHLAVQLARTFGAAQVDAVTSGKNMDFVRGLGVDNVINRETSNITETTERYDAIIDTALAHPLGKMQALLAPHGTLALVGMVKMTDVLKVQLQARILSQTFARIVAPIGSENTADIQFLLSEVAAGRLKPHISQTYTLEQTAEAMAHLGAGRVQGKLVVRPTK